MRFLAEIMEEKDDIASILLNKILQSPQLIQLIEQRVDLKIQTIKQEQTLTRKQMAEMYQVSEQTIDRLTEEDLEDRGFRKIRIGVSVRFERIAIVGVSKKCKPL